MKHFITAVIKPVHYLSTATQLLRLKNLKQSQTNIYKVTSRCKKLLPIPLLFSNCLDLKPVEELTVAKLIAVVEKAIAPNSFLLLPVDISSGPSRCSELPVHCPPARTMDCTRSFMAGMQMKANDQCGQ